jgi:superoxide reductase
MTKRNQLYKCVVCGNIVSVNHASTGKLVCCGKLMDVLMANTVDTVTEKHIPFVNIGEDEIRVIIGEIEHSMEEGHYIEWVTLITGNETQTIFLAPGDKPEVVFDVISGKKVVYAYCNLHGLWQKEL